MVLGVLYAQDDATKGKEAVSRNGVTFYVESNSVLKQDILSGKMDNAIKLIKQNKSNQKVARSPAPPVSAVYVVRVGSTQGGIEDISVNQQTTTNDHGGAEMLVATFVIGYGGSQYDSATYAGVSVPQMQSACWDGNNDSICDGWVDYWNLSGYGNSGLFVFKARSINPGPTKQVSIMIK